MIDITCQAKQANSKLHTCYHTVAFVKITTVTTGYRGSVEALRCTDHFKPAFCQVSGTVVLLVGWCKEHRLSSSLTNGWGQNALRQKAIWVYILYDSLLLICRYLQRSVLCSKPSCHMTFIAESQETLPLWQPPLWPAVPEVQVLINKPSHLKSRKMRISYERKWILSFRCKGLRIIQRNEQELLISINAPWTYQLCTDQKNVFH